MYSVNDKVVYGTHGVCLVKAIGPLSIRMEDTERLYYTLQPLYTQGSVIYTPVDNEKSLIRSAISKQEALSLIAQMPQIETVWVADEKKREENYKEIMSKNECRGWIQIIKTLYLKKQRRLAEGKKSTAKDDFYLKLAKDLLYGEFSTVLDVDKEEVDRLIAGHITDTDLMEEANLR